MMTHQFRHNPMRTRLYGAFTMFMKADEDMGHHELEKMLMLAGATELQADEIIGTLGSFRDMVYNLYHEFSFMDLRAVVAKRETICLLLAKAINDDLDIANEE